MSRLDSVIERLQAQRACLERAAAAIGGLPGPVFELGLGNGRSYDHLRRLLPDREIFVFDRRLFAHPDSIPPRRYLTLGDFSATLKATADEFSGRAALVHADIGANDRPTTSRSARLVARYAPGLLRRGGFLVCDQEVGGADLEPLPLQAGIPPGRYFVYRRL